MNKYFTSSLLTLLFFLNSSLGNAQQNSLLFDGVDDKVTVPANTLFNSANALTVEAWINATQWKSQSFQGTIIGKDASNSSGYVLRCGANGKLSFTIGNGTAWIEAISNSIMQTNLWYHVAGVFDNGNMYIYINGIQYGSNTASTIAASTSGLDIGESPAYAGRVFQGYIDEVRIWNIARSQSQIAANDTVDLPNNEPGLVAYYKFNQVTGTTTPNEITSTTNSTGTLVNFPANPWAPGYALSGTDLSANAIISPDIITFFSQPSRVRARFKNTGSDSIFNYSVGYQIDAGPKVIENVNDTILPGQEKEYSFHEVIESGNNSSYILKVFNALTGDNNQLNDTISYTLVHPTGNNNVIPLFTSVIHDFASNGQSHISKVPLPDENTKFSHIIMKISVACPPNGCDPWDQPAKISLLKDGQTYEIARFITPYWIACGPWTVDVTDFKSMLKGACTFESYIQSWLSTGWSLNVSLTFIDSATTYPYQKVTRLWETDNWVYGDPAISYDLPLQTVNIHPSTKQLDFRMTISGHGQGNTQNAAEFSPKIHTVVVNGSNIANHSLWKNNCAQNACKNQGTGNWTPNRAGWCPGQEVQPFMVNLTPYYTAGQAITVDYVLQSYLNVLNTGYNGNSHTEPHYKIHAFLVEKSDSFIDGSTYRNAAATRITFPLTNNDLSAATLLKVMIHNTGTTVISQPDLYYFINGVQTAHETPSFAINPGDSLEYIFSTTANLIPGNEYRISAMISSAGDEASSDDVASIIINGNVSTGEIINNDYNFTIYPNPNEGVFTLINKTIHEDGEIKITDMIGKTVFKSKAKKEEINNGYKISLHLKRGAYLVQLLTVGNKSYQKLIIE